MCQVQEFNEYVVATEAKALRDLEGVREDRSEYEMLAAEARERAIGMRAERNLAFEVAQDAEKKVIIMSVTMISSVWYLMLFPEGGEGGEGGGRKSSCEAWVLCCLMQHCDVIGFIVAHNLIPAAVTGQTPSR